MQGIATLDGYKEAQVNHEQDELLDKGKAH